MPSFDFLKLLWGKFLKWKIHWDWDIECFKGRESKIESPNDNHDGFLSTAKRLKWGWKEFPTIKSPIAIYSLPTQLALFTPKSIYMEIEIEMTQHESKIFVFISNPWDAARLNMKYDYVEASKKKKKILLWILLCTIQPIRLQLFVNHCRL